ncbi:uncharacterized protein LOC143930466 isoform X1 [Lithobates pipiens]
MPEYRITYFPIRARAEPIRLLLADQGASWTEDEVQLNDWWAGKCELKKTAVFGQLPQFQDGDFVLYQSNTILRYLGSKFGIAGSNNQENAFIDMVNDGVEDLRQKYSRLIFIEYFPSTPQEWQTVASQFAAHWDFPNCGGAIDGKHVRIVPPPHSGSYYWNYKGFHSVVLMAVVSAQCDFLYVGKNGRMSDGGVFRQTEFCHRLITGGLDLPPDAENVEGLPFVFLVDEAFGLSDHLMKPFPQRTLTPERRVFNYRLARARRVVESAFGIMASRFRLLLTAINLAEYKLNYVILCCCILHNFLRKLSGNQYLQPIGPEAGLILPELTGLDHALPGLAPQTAREVRDHYVSYFNGRGAIPMPADQ